MRPDIVFLQQWPRPFRQVIFVFLIVALAGFSTGLAYLAQNTKFSPTGITTYYKGNENMPDTEISRLHFAKSINELLITTHNHLLGLTTIFLLVSVLYLLTGRISTLKMAIALEPFLSLLITFGGIWIVRFFYSPFVYLVLISGILMSISFIWMVVRTMVACLGK